MEDQTKDEVSRRKFLRNATLGTVGAALLNTLPSNDATATSWRSDFDCNKLDVSRRHQIEREEVEEFFRTWYTAADNLDLGTFMASFSPNILNQDAIIGDISFNGFSVNGPNCGIEGETNVRAAFGQLFQFVRTPGRLFKFNYATGSLKYGATVGFVDLPGTFYYSGVDLIGYHVIRDGKIVRRNDYYDTAQMTAADIARIHPNGMPRLSCVASTLPGDTSHASREMYEFTLAFHNALSSGDTDRVIRFFTDEAVLIHPLLHQGSGGYGLFNRGIQIRGRKALALFFKAVLPVLPDGAQSTITHIIGGSTGGGYEWHSAGIYAQQGIGRNGILGVTSISLFENRIDRMSVKFDTVQMTSQQRAVVRRALTGECLVVQ